LSVREVQQLLTDLGYDPGPVDGAWGAKTLAALNALRAAHGLPEVGALDESSLELLAQLRKG
jgi:peptidoglycan hydrolase-like protein with peptidoglycan-binding domain